MFNTKVHAIYMCPYKGLVHVIVHVMIIAKATSHLLT